MGVAHWVQNLELWVSTVQPQAPVHVTVQTNPVENSNQVNINEKLQPKFDKYQPIIEHKNYGHSKGNVNLFELTLSSTDNTHLEVYGDSAYIFISNFKNITSIFHSQINRAYYYTVISFACLPWAT